MSRDHRDRLLRSVETWNEWRKEHPDVRPLLDGFVFNSQAAERTPRFRPSRAFQPFQARSFAGVDLHDADLRSARAWSTDLSSANLSGADLRDADFRNSRLEGADLRGADLRGAYFERSHLGGASFEDAKLGGTRFGFSVLAGAQGLENVRHGEPSHLDTFSLASSLPLPAALLGACGVPDHVVRMAEWWRAHGRPYHTCFISYSRRDEVFAGYLREALTWAGVPCWFAPTDLRERGAEDPDPELERDLFGYVRSAERLVLVVSPNLIPSTWVPRELQQAASVLPRVSSLNSVAVSL